MFFDSEEYALFTKELDEIFGTVDKYKDMYEITREQAQKEVSLYTEFKDKACLGEKAAREYLINQYSKFVLNLCKKNCIDINNLIDFEDIQNNDIKIIFEMLINVCDMGDIIKKYEFHTRITEEQIREVVSKEHEKIKEYYSNLNNRIRLIAIFIYTREYGQDCIDTLQHHDINEIGILDKDYIYIICRPGKVHLKFLSFKDKSIILNIQKKNTQNSPLNYDQHNPTLVAAKNNASRITVAGFDATPTDEDLYYNERIFNLSKIILEEMRDRFNTINQFIFEFLILNQDGRGSHFVTAADMGCGKSTFLLAMMEKVPDIWGIGVLDTQNELQAKKKYPRKNIMTLIENPRLNIAKCFAIMLKMARDVLYVGEITQPQEVAELINASLRLNSGVGATLHSLSPFEVVTNLRNLLLRTDMYTKDDIAEADVARGLDLVLHLAKLPSGRIVVEYIVEIEYIEQNTYVKDINEGTLKERFMAFLKLAQQGLAKYLYRKNYKYNTIVRYDRKLDMWIPENLPSDTYFEKIFKYVGAERIENFKQQFKLEKERLKEEIRKKTQEQQS